MKRGRLKVAIVVSMMPLASAALASQAVVVESTAPAYPSGQVLEETADVTIPAGNSVSLITADGGQITLTGPYQGKVVSAQGGKSSVATALASLIAERGVDTSTVGAVRVTNPQGELPEPWLVDATKSGKVCVRPAAPLVLFRHNSADEDEVTLGPADGSWTQILPWPAGDFYLPLGEDVQVAEGTSLRIQTLAAESTVTFHVVPAQVDGRMAAAFLATKGCNDQAVALLRTLPN